MERYFLSLAPYLHRVMDLLRSKIRRDEQGQFVCMICDEARGSEEDIFSHFSVHTEGKAFVCSTCLAGFATDAELKSHSDRMHPTAEKPGDSQADAAAPIAPGGGVAPTTSSGGDALHANAERPVDNQNGMAPPMPAAFGHFLAHSSEDKPFVCSVCFAAFAAETELKYHSADCHTPARNSHDNPPRKANNEKRSTTAGSADPLAETEVIAIKVEDLVSTPDQYDVNGEFDMSQYDYHLEYKPKAARSKTGKRKYVRRKPKEECKPKIRKKIKVDGEAGDDDEPSPPKKKGKPRRLSAEQRVRNEYASASLGPFKCTMPGCDYQSVWKCRLVRHLPKHLDFKPFKCTECDYTTRWRSNIRAHLMHHTGEKRFSCHLCDHKASHKANITAHIETKHYNKKAYMCDFCSLSFSQKGNLAVHIRTKHTGEKPYKCDFPDCEYSAYRGDALTLHRYTHTSFKPFQCSKCNYATAWKNNLQHHSYTHSEAKPFNCEKCSFSTTRRDYLRKHIATHGGHYAAEERSAEEPSRQPPRPPAEGQSREEFSNDPAEQHLLDSQSREIIRSIQNEGHLLESQSREIIRSIQNEERLLQSQSREIDDSCSQNEDNYSQCDSRDAFINSNQKERPHSEYRSREQFVENPTEKYHQEYSLQLQRHLEYSLQLQRQSEFPSSALNFERS